MDKNLLIALIPLLPIVISGLMLLKKPLKASLLSRSMTVLFLGFCVVAYFGNELSKDNPLFSTLFGILAIYTVVAVSVMMYFSAALRQAQKRQAQHQQETKE